MIKQQKHIQKMLASESQDSWKLKMNKKLGHFVFGDVPEGISMVKKMGDKLMMSVKWKKRDDGMEPIPT